MSKDEVFKETCNKAVDFKFTNKVACVFDDMVTRSVPFYEEMQRMIGELTVDHYQDNSFVYDLGCSTGTTMICMNESVPPHVPFVGIVDSQPMLDKCREKLDELGIKREIKLEIIAAQKDAQKSTELVKTERKERTPQIINNNQYIINNNQYIEIHR